MRDIAENYNFSWIYNSLDIFNRAEYEKIIEKKVIKLATAKIHTSQKPPRIGMVHCIELDLKRYYGTFLAILESLNIIDKETTTLIVQNFLFCFHEYVC